MVTGARKTRTRNVAPCPHDSSGVAPSVADCSSSSAAAVTGPIGGFRATGASDAVWARIEEFVTDAVAEVPDLSAAKARTYATVLARHTGWCWQTCGYPLDRNIVLAPAVIAESIERLEGFTDASRRTFRSRLLAMSDVLTSQGSGRTVLPPISRSLQSAPYTAREVATLRAWAGMLPTQHQRVNVTIGLALGLGAGLRMHEITALRAGDVTIDDLGVVVDTGGSHARQVPVLAEWADVIADLAGAALRAEQFLFRPRRTAVADRNAFANLLRRTKPPVSLTTHRMRATWIVGHLAAGIPATTLVVAAGLESTDALRLYLPFIPELNTRDYRVRLMHGHDLFGTGAS